MRWTISVNKKTRNNGEWTEARWRSFIVSALRSATSRYPPKYKALNQAKTEKKVNSETGRVAQHFNCAECLKDYPQTKIQVDHIIPVVGESGFTNWNEYIERMFCDVDNFQILCKECHGLKTQMEREKSKLSKGVLRKE